MDILNLDKENAIKYLERLKKIINKQKELENQEKRIINDIRKWKKEYLWVIYRNRSPLVLLTRLELVPAIIFVIIGILIANKIDIFLTKTNSNYNEIIQTALLIIPIICFSLGIYVIKNISPFKEKREEVKSKLEELNERYNLVVKESEKIYKAHIKKEPLFRGILKSYPRNILVDELLRYLRDDRASNLREAIKIFEKEMEG